MPSGIWKSVLGVGALAGVILSVAGVIGLFSSDEPAKPARPLVDRIEQAASRYGSALNGAIVLNQVVGREAFDRWTSDAARIDAALRADFPEQREAWRRYDNALRTAQLLLDANAVQTGSGDFRVLQARRLVELARTGDATILTDPGHPDYALEWASVLGWLDEQRARLVDELLSSA